MASWPRASRPVGSRVLLRFTHLDQEGISSAGSFVHRRGVNARLYSFRRNNTIDSTAHDLVALACRCFEPRSVNLDQAPPIRSDRTRRPELAHDMRHGRSTYSKQLRKRLLRHGRKSPSTRSWMWSNHRAKRASTECSALQAATCWNCASSALV